jgi:hypothetical protein
MAYTTPMMLRVRYYKSWRQDIEAEFEARRRELEDERLKAIKALNEAWLKMGGAEEDLTAPTVEVKDSSPEEVTADAPQEGAPTLNGSPGRAVPMDVIREEIQSVLSDPVTESITQPEVKDRVLKRYPDAKIANIRTAISRLFKQQVEQGELELIEKGLAGAPNKYRKVTQQVEEETATKEEPERLLLKSEP